MEEVLQQIIRDTGTFGLVLIGIFLFAKYILGQLTDMTKTTAEERKTLFELISQVPASVSEILAGVQSMEAALHQLQMTVQDLEKEITESLEANETRLKEFITLIVSELKRDHAALLKTISDLQEAITRLKK